MTSVSCESLNEEGDTYEFADKLSEGEEKYLSRNDAVFRYRETMEEKMWDLEDKFMVLEDDIAASLAESGGPEAEAAAEEKREQMMLEVKMLFKTAKEIDQAVYKVLDLEHSRGYLLRTGRFGRHFRVMPEMKVAAVKKRAMGTTSGVSE